MRRITVVALLSMVAATSSSSCSSSGGGDQPPGAAPSATSAAATSIGEAGATLNGAVNPNGLATQAWFEYGTTTALGARSPAQELGSGSVDHAVSADLTALAPGTLHHFRVCAQNSAGYSEGQVLTFQTAAPGSPPAVVTIAATAVDTTGATLNGTVIPNGVATTAWFEWGTEATLAHFSATGAQDVGAGTASQTKVQVLSGLTAGTRYYFRIAASNAAGTSRGEVLSFQTASPGSAPAVVTTAATAVVTSGATLSATVNPNALATSAWFEWGPDSTLAQFSATGAQDLGSGTASRTVTQALIGLSAETRYYFRIAASNAAGTSRGEILGFQTAAAAPPPTATTLAVTSVGQTSATLNGAVNPNGSATSVSFEWGTSATLATFDSTASQAVGAGTTPQPVTDTLTGLTPGTTYYYRVVASSAAGRTAGSIASFTTDTPYVFTVVSTSPVDNATGVPLGAVITITFSHDVEAASLVGAITVTCSAGELPGVTSYDFTTRTAVFTPSVLMAAATHYTVTVDGKVKSAETVRLGTPYVFGFTTAPAS